VFWMSVDEMSDVSKRPKVGTSQSRPRTTITT
jgi:hypothetical protein